ncbi:perilipin-3 isoform X1 [Tachyglossus aculeatus]|uniref:perilipin-3 isoform X1 n=1 Tax=Tachyglossus aculeatus TaxID=9261 RepID=UPI0018F42A8F|nr:perilipin-3 isoform X1 [Tachyglossus aculeatus]XP_038596044.1 perilipin-3 isoform X1 [Tachyglossus aculeatus]
MSANGAEAGAQAEEEPTQQSVVGRVANMPLVSSTCNMVSAAYTSTKESYPYVKSVCDMAEQGVKTITAAAVSGAQPLLTKLETQIASANEYAHKGLDRLEEKLPILQQPSDKVIADTRERVSSTVTGAKDAVTSRVTGAVDMTREAVQSGMDLTKSVMTSGVNTVVGSRVGQMVLSGVDAVLGKSEEWVDNYLPMTDEELAKIATSLEGFDMASVQQQRLQQSYFVRLGSLSSKLHHRAYQHSVGKLRQTKQSTQEALMQLQQAISLVEHVKQGVDQKILDGQEKLHQMWLSWNQKQLQGTEEKAAPQPEQVESQTLAMFRAITQQVQANSTTLLASVQGLPGHIQEQVQQVRHAAEELHAAFAGAGSFQALSGSLLSQSREKVGQARQALDEMLDYVAQNAPATWLVGPFAPARSELPPAPEEKAQPN